MKALSVCERGTVKTISITPREVNLTGPLREDPPIRDWNPTHFLAEFAIKKALAGQCFWYFGGTLLIRYTYVQSWRLGTGIIWSRVSGPSRVSRLVPE